MSSLLKGLDGSAIVYVLTKKDAEQLAVDVRETSHVRSRDVATCNSMFSILASLPTRFRYFAVCVSRILLRSTQVRPPPLPDQTLPNWQPKRGGYSRRGNRGVEGMQALKHPP